MATCSNCRKEQAVYRVKSSVLGRACFAKTEGNYRTHAERISKRRHRRGNRKRDFQPHVEFLKHAVRS